MKLARHDLVAALSLRYDHYSAQNVFEAACQRANLADQDHYDLPQVAAFRAALAKVGDRLARVDERLDSLLGAAKPAEPTPAPTPVVAKPAPEVVQPVAAPVVAKPAPEGAAVVAKPVDVPVTELVLRDVEVADGEALFVCGDRAELGNWDPEHARPMRRAGKDWSAVVPSGEGAFKFLRRSAAGEVTWEGGDNRDLGTAVKIETSWQP